MRYNGSGKLANELKKFDIIFAEITGKAVIANYF